MSLQIRAKHDPGITLADSQRGADKVSIVEGGWYFHPNMVDMTHIEISDRLYNCPYKGVARWVDLITPTKTARNIGWVYEDPKHGFEHIAGLIAFYGRETSATIATQCEEKISA